MGPMGKRMGDVEKKKALEAREKKGHIIPLWIKEW